MRGHFAAILIVAVCAFGPSGHAAITVTANANGNHVTGTDAVRLCAEAYNSSGGLSSGCPAAVPLVDLPQILGTASVAYPVVTAAVARADGSTGKLAARAWAVSNTGLEDSFARATLTDTITFLTPNPVIITSVAASFASDGADATSGELGLVYSFGVGSPLFRVSAGRVRGPLVPGGAEEFFYYGDDLNPFGYSEQFPGNGNPRVWGDSITLNVPVGVPLYLEAILRVRAECAATESQPCVNLLESMGTASIRILGAYVSESGYQYDTEIAAIPEPATALLTGAGLILTAVWLRKRSQRQ